ncbi:MAG: hypothetical protein US49_C0005G0057 [candidate division TM6 bacterium GW2011_GWF2_37_49]|nr:MAG: hypothetical protein US49_C0005G0057 [candidate division TM6 bacterium GW2011_GWF2_37_49]
MKKLVLFSLLICLSFGQFSAMEDPEEAKKASSKKARFAKFIANLAWKSRAPMGAIAGGVVGGVSGIGVMTGAEIGSGIGVGSKLFGVQRGTATYFSYRYLSAPISNFLWNYLNFASVQDFLVYNGTGFLGQIWNYSFGCNFPVMPAIYGALASTVIGLAAFYATISLLSYGAQKYCDAKLIAAIQADAQEIIANYLTPGKKWNLDIAWAKIWQYEVKTSYFSIAPSAHGSAEKLEKQVGPLVMLQFIPILACALYKDETLDIQPNAALANKIIDYVDNVITDIVAEKPTQLNLLRGQKLPNKNKMIDAWLKSRYAMLYQVCHLNPASPTVAQQVFLGSDTKLSQKLFKNVPDNVIKEIVLLNRDKYGRTLMHHTAKVKNTETLKAFSNLLFDLYKTHNQKGYVAIPEADQTKIKAAMIYDLTKNFFALHTRKLEGLGRAEFFGVDATPSSSKVKEKTLASDIVDYQLQNPLHKAAINFNSEFINMFFDDPELLEMAMLQQDTDKRTPLHLAVMMATDINMEHIEKYNPKTRKKATATIQHLITGLNEETAYHFLATPDCKGKTPLHYAAEAKNGTLISYMLNAVARPGPQTWLRKFFHRKFGQADTLKVVDQHGNTPLHAAVMPSCRCLQEFTPATIDEEIEKYVNFLQIDKKDETTYKEHGQAIAAYVNSLVAKSKEDPAKLSKIKRLYQWFRGTSTIAQVASQTCPGTMHEGSKLLELSQAMEGKAVSAKQEAEGSPSEATTTKAQETKAAAEAATASEAASEQKEATSNFIDQLYHELNHLKIIVDLERAKKLLQQHKVERYFKFDTLTAPESDNIIPATIANLLTGISREDRFELLKIQNLYGQTALHLAMTQDNIKIITALLQMLVPGTAEYLTQDQIIELFSIRDQNGYTPLHTLTSAKHGTENKVEEDAYEKSQKMLTSLFAGEAAIVKGLTPEQREKLLSIKDGRGQTIIHAMVQNGYNYQQDIAPLFAGDTELQNKLFLFQDNNGKTPLSSAMSLKHEFLPAIVEQLAASADLLTKQNNHGQTIFHTLAMSGNLEVISALLKNKTDDVKLAALQKLDEFGMAPLHYIPVYIGRLTREQKEAGEIGRIIDGVNKILQDQGEPAQKTLLETKTGKTKQGRAAHNQTLLHLSTLNSVAADFIEYLKGASADWLAQDSNGDTALTLASKAGDVPTMVELIKFAPKTQQRKKQEEGQSVTIDEDMRVMFLQTKNKDGMSFMHYIALSNLNTKQLEPILNILTLGGFINCLSIQDKLKQTALHKAASVGNVNFNQLITKTANETPFELFNLLRIQDHNGQTPLHVALATFPHNEAFEGEEKTDAIAQAVGQLDKQLEKLRKTQAKTDSAYRTAIVDLGQGKITQSKFIKIRAKDLSARQKIERIEAQRKVAAQKIENLAAYLNEKANHVTFATNLLDAYVQAKKSEIGAQYPNPVIELQDNNGNSALHLAAQLGNADLINAFKTTLSDEFIVALRVLNKNGDTPLHIAIAKDDVNSFTTLANGLNKNQIIELIKLKKRWRLPLLGKKLLYKAFSKKGLSDFDIARGKVREHLEKLEQPEAIPSADAELRKRNVGQAQITIPVTLSLPPTTPETTPKPASIPTVEAAHAAAASSTPPAISLKSSPPAETGLRKRNVESTKATPSTEEQQQAAKAAIEAILENNPQEFLTLINEIKSETDARSCDGVEIKGVAAGKKRKSITSIILRKTSGDFVNHEVQYKKTELTDWLSQKIQDQVVPVITTKPKTQSTKKQNTQSTK